MLKAMQVSMPLVAPAEPLAQRGAQPPLGQFVDQPVAFGERHEARRRDHAGAGSSQRTSASTRLSVPSVERDLGLVDHVQPTVDQRPLEPVEQPEVARRDHGASVGFSSSNSASSASSRVGFSSGPTMRRPSASPRRKALSSTRRSKPEMISTGPAKPVGEEAQQFDPVAARHAEVERDHRGALAQELGAEIVVAVGDLGGIAAQVPGLGDEVGKLRLIVDQQQSG